MLIMVNILPHILQLTCT